MMRPTLWLSLFLFIAHISLAAAAESEKPFAPKFYAFENGVAFGDYQQEAETLKQLGCDGISQVSGDPEKLTQRIAAYDKAGLQVLSVYLNVDDAPIAADTVRPLADRGALIELTVRKMTPDTVAAVRQTAEMASQLHIRVALYPHHGFAVATIPQALDLIAKVDHPNLGVMFNLCHFLKNEDPQEMAKALQQAAPHLFAVSTAGADRDGTDWSQLIQPLDQGDFVQQRLFLQLKQLGFDGPVSLQCYAVPGDKKQNLQRSIAAWRKIIAATSAAAEPATPAASAKRPNVLFIAVDDFRVQLGCYGDPLVKTPNIDRLAGRGMLFQQAYCQQALCNPSRTSVLTGRYPDSLGIWNLPTHFREVAPQIVTLPQHFRQLGYYARDIGKIFHNYGQKIENDPLSWSTPSIYDIGAHSQDWYVEGQPFELHKLPKGPSFQRVDVPDEAYLDGRIAAAAVKEIERQADLQQPFFLAVGFWKPHLPFNAPQKYWDLYDPAEIESSLQPQSPGDAPEIARHDNREVRGYTDIPKQGEISAAANLRLHHGYYAAISFVDAQIGKVLDALEATGQADDTIVVLWSDHGFHLGEHELWCKTSNFELDAHVPLLIADPRVRPAQRKTTALVELVDLYPTLVDLCELPPVENLDGKSLRPILHDPSHTVRTSALTQHPRPAYYKGKPDVMGYSIRTDQYRYTEWRNFATGAVEAVELYDHQTDPAELHNLAGQDSQQSTQTNLAVALEHRIAAAKK
ncbi:sulfatase-like hydrolase/transferase [Blastopirellula marina]|nr:sulfatase-like hydrolase/transferase [Blastopirellula marina]